MRKVLKYLHFSNIYKIFASFLSKKLNDTIYYIKRACFIINYVWE